VFISEMNNQNKKSDTENFEKLIIRYFYKD